MLNKDKGKETKFISHLQMGSAIHTEIKGPHSQEAKICFPVYSFIQAENVKVGLSHKRSHIVQ